MTFQNRHSTHSYAPPEAPVSKRSWSITADKFLTQQQVAQLLQYLLNRRDLAIARGEHSQAIRDYYIVRGLLETGLRVFEFCALVNSDFHGHKLNVRCGKGGRPRTVLLTRGTANLLKEWLALKQQMGFDCCPQAPMFPSRYGRRYTTRGIQSRIEIIFDELGLPEQLSTHSLRHTYCSLLLESRKVSLTTAKENMGHSSLTTTNLYSHAVGNLEDVDLFSTSEIYNKSEIHSSATPLTSNKPNNRIKLFMGNTNFNRGQLNVRWA